MRGEILLIITMVILTTCSYSHYAIAQNTIKITSINIAVNIDPDLNLSYVEETIYFASKSPTPVTLYIPLVSPDLETISFLRAYGENDVEYPANYVKENKSIEVIVANTTYIKITYLAVDLLAPLGIGAYDFSIDTSFEGVDNISATIYIPKDYTPMVCCSNYMVVTDNLTEIKLLEKDVYYIMIMLNMTIPTETTTPTTISPPTQTTGGGTTPIETTPTTTSTPTASSSTGPTGTTTPTSQVPSTNWILPLAIIVAAIAAVAAYILISRRRAGGIVVETISPTDILSDDVVKDIIVAVGNAGEKGITQNRLVHLLGRSKSTISRKIKRLVEYGYIEVERAGRSNIVRLTRKGWDAYKKLRSGEAG